MKRLLFIYNPIAGKGLIVNRLHTVIDFYTQRGYLVSILPTGKTNVLVDVLKRCQYEFDLAVCAGGDGTLNGVISACMETSSDIPLGYLPMGSTNDFARTLGYSMDLTEALNKSCAEQVSRLDIGKFGNRYFTYIAAFGSLVEVSYSTSQVAKNILGYFAYLLKGIQKITDLKAHRIHLETEENCIDGEFFMGLVMNSLSIAGFRNPVSQDVVLNDGLFEVLLIRMPKNLNELQMIIVDLLNQRIDSEMFVYTQTGHMKIQAEQLNWTLDGEFGGLLDNVEIWNCKQAMRIVGV